MEIQLRCQNHDESFVGRLHGVVVDGHLLDVSCRSRNCGKRKGVVVIHRFDIKSGECISTRRYTEATITKGSEHGSNQGSALRSA